MSPKTGIRYFKFGEKLSRVLALTDVIMICLSLVYPSIDAIFFMELLVLHLGTLYICIDGQDMIKEVHGIVDSKEEVKSEDLRPKKKDEEQ
jgi:hypothetical protein